MSRALDDSTYRSIITRLREHASYGQTCRADAVGAAIVFDGYTMLVGINGAPAGIASCETAGCEWIAAGTAGTGRDHARHLHAEAAAICQAAGAGRRIAGADIVVTRAPCPTCALLIVASGIVRVVFPRSTMPAQWNAVAEALAGGGVQVIALSENDHANAS